MLLTLIWSSASILAYSGAASLAGGTVGLGTRWLRCLAVALLLVECRVDRHAISVGEPIGLVRHPDNRHHLAEHGVGHAGLARGRGVARDAVAAAVGDADGEVDHLFRERIERAGRHHLLDA